MQHIHIGRDRLPYLSPDKRQLKINLSSSKIKGINVSVATVAFREIRRSSQIIAVQKPTRFEACDTNYGQHMLLPMEHTRKPILLVQITCGGTLPDAATSVWNSSTAGQK